MSINYFRGILGLVWEILFWFEPLEMSQECPPDPLTFCPGGPCHSRSPPTGGNGVGRTIWNSTTPIVAVAPLSALLTGSKWFSLSLSDLPPLPPSHSMPHPLPTPSHLPSLPRAVKPLTLFICLPFHFPWRLTCNTSSWNCANANRQSAVLEKVYDFDVVCLREDVHAHIGHQCFKTSESFRGIKAMVWQ